MPSVLVNVDGDRHLVEPIPYWHAPRADRLTGRATRGTCTGTRQAASDRCSPRLLLLEAPAHPNVHRSSVPEAKSSIASFWLHLDTPRPAVSQSLVSRWLRCARSSPRTLPGEGSMADSGPERPFVGPKFVQSDSERGALTGRDPRDRGLLAARRDRPGARWLSLRVAARLRGAGTEDRPWLSSCALRR